MHKRALVVVAISAVLMGNQAWAVEKGNLIVRMGVGYVNPDDSSSDFSGAPGVGASVGSDTSLTINATYMLTDNIGLDVLGALPFEHDLSATGALSGDVGSVKQLPPTIGLQYQFMPKNNIRPYVGVGVNYTHFWDEDLKQHWKSGIGLSRPRRLLGLGRSSRSRYRY